MKKNRFWLGVSLLMLVALVLPSCAPNAVTPTTTAPTAIVPTEVPLVTGTPTTPKPEGDLIVSITEARNEGFLLWTGVGQVSLWDTVYDYAIYVKTDGTLIGGLAERWETSADATAVTFWLRQGIPWQDGLGPDGSNTGKWGDVTAEDFKYTVERTMGSDSPNINAPGFRDSIESIEVVDPYTITFHLVKPNPTWYLYLTDVQGKFTPILCKKYIEAVGDEIANNTPVGSGPYRLIEHQFGDYFKFQAIEDHWRVVPEFKYLTIKIIPEESTAIAMLKTGALDFTSISSSESAGLKEAGFGIGTVPGGSVVWLPIGGLITPDDNRYEAGYDMMDPWVDIRVREAMNIAIDRQAIIDTLYFGAGEPMPISYQTPGYQDLAPRAYDPEKARQLLIDAGYPNGFSFDVYSYTRDFDAPVLMEMVAGYWEQIGLKPKIVMSDWTTFKSDHRATARTAGLIWEEENSWRLEWGASMINRYTPNGSSPNFMSPELTALMESVIVETDLVKTDQIWHEISKYLYDNYTDIPIANVMPTIAFSSKVEGMSPMLSTEPARYAYLRHAKPLKTFRLFQLDPGLE